MFLVFELLHDFFIDIAQRLCRIAEIVKDAILHLFMDTPYSLIVSKWSLGKEQEFIDQFRGRTDQGGQRAAAVLQREDQPGNLKGCQYRTQSAQQQIHCIHGSAETHLALVEIVYRPWDLDAVLLQQHESGGDTHSHIDTVPFLENLRKIAADFPSRVLRIVFSTPLVGKQRLERGLEHVVPTDQSR